jgi:CRP-like cAMP-binding protein
MKTNTHLDEEELKKIEKIKSLLEIPPKKRGDKTCLELMNLTKDLKVFENIARSIEHQNICSSITLVMCKPNEVVIRQGDQGDSLYYILHGLVTIQLSIQIDTGIQDKNQIVIVEKNIGELRDGEIFGELALLYNIPRTASVIALTDTSLIKIDKMPFTKYLKNVFEGQLQDQIEFLQICPIFNKMPKELLIKLGIRSVIKKFATGQIILKNDTKSESIFVIRRGTVKVIKEILFIKNENKIRKKRLRRNRSQILDYEDYTNRQQLENEKVLELLALGPSEEDMREGNFIKKSITLEILKIGDIFPSYYSSNELYLDVQFESDNPCELIELDISHIKEIIPETFEFIKKYSKPYPSEEFLRRFHYYNESWLKYKKDLKYSILADSLNKNTVKKNDMRTKIYKKKDIIGLKLPLIFSPKNQNMKFK